MSRPLRTLAVLVACAAPLLAASASCGGSAATSIADGGTDALLDPDAAKDGATDAAEPPPALAPFACGAQTCGVREYCVHPCCGGPAPACEPRDDGGACQPGFHAAACRGMQDGCQADDCKPEPPHCVASPAQSGCFDPSTSGPDPRQISCVCA